MHLLISLGMVFVVQKEKKSGVFLLHSLMQEELRCSVSLIKEFISKPKWKCKNNFSGFKRKTTGQVNFSCCPESGGEVGNKA